MELFGPQNSDLSLRLDEALSSVEEHDVQPCYEDKPFDGGICGDCWHNKASNIACMIFFSFELLMLIVITSLMLCYHYNRKLA